MSIFSSVSSGLWSVANYAGYEQRKFTLQGSLKHPQEWLEAATPMTKQKVAVFVKSWFGARHVGNFTTTKDGSFQMEYKWNILSWTSSHELVFKVMEETLQVGGKKSSERVVDQASRVINHSKQVHNLKLEAHLYEYLDHRPGLRPPANEKQRPQQFGLTFNLRLGIAAIAKRALGVLGDLKRRFFPTADTVAKVEKRFGVEIPPLRLTSAETVRMLLDGLYPCQFRKGEREGELIVDINWDRYEQDGPPPQLPNIRASLFPKGDTYEILEIAESEDNWIKIHKPEQDSFERALYLFNSAAVLKGEIVSHLGMGHIWAEQCAMAIFRWLNDSALGSLLRPHHRETVEINRVGQAAIFGESGVLNRSGLSQKGIEEALLDVLASMDYSTFSPRPPICKSDNFAKQKAIYWKMLGDVIDKYFATNMDDILENWWQVYGMSEDLVKHSLEYRPLDGIKEHSSWLMPTEIDDPSVPGRVEYRDKLRAIRPITQSKDEPSDGDIERLKQFCRFTMYMSTFWHSKLHYTQNPYVTTLQWASLAPRNGARDGVHGGTSPEDAEHQLRIGLALTDFVGWNIAEDEHGDIIPALKSALEDARPALEELGCNVDQIQQTIVI